ncbi:MAG: transposase [Gammaproteobacteria bacterium]
MPRCGSAAHQRKKLEHLCRYITRPAIANERLTLNRAGQVVLTLKTPYRDGTTHIVMSPLEFMQRLAALVPRPRLHLIRFHGVLAPNAKLRREIIPSSGRQAGNLPVPGSPGGVNAADTSDDHGDTPHPSAPTRIGGGAEGRLFERFSDEDDTGNTFSGDLALQLDTGKAGLWPGGFFKARIEGRAGESVVRRAGTISSVNKDAILPNVTDRFDEEVFGLTELTAMQFLSERFGVVGGLLNTVDGDGNDIAGSARSDAHFLNLSFLMSLVEMATAPNVTLGGGVIVLPTKDITGTLTAFDTEESAAENPFEHGDGTTLATEWSVKHTLGGHPGGQRVGFLYGFDKNRADIAQDPRVIIASLLQGRPIPSTDSDTWALYYNAYQYVQGGSDRGWGPFVRFGYSDGDPNPVESNVAVGLGGKGLLPGRDADNWARASTISG